MRVLLVHCHPKEESFTAAVRDTVLARLKKAGAEIRVADLYAEGFDPVLSGVEWDTYESVPENRGGLDGEIERILWCDTLIFVYPTWWYGLPAMLKGWLDRVLLPGVAFEMPAAEGQVIRPALTHITRLAAFTTCGASRLLTTFVGSPGRRTLLRGVGLLCHPGAKCVFSAHYLMDGSTPGSRAAHLSRIDASVIRLIAGREVTA